MKLAPMSYVYSTDSKKTVIHLLTQWAGDNRLVIENPKKLERLTRSQLFAICEQLRYTPKVDTDMARKVFAEQGISVTGYSMDNGTKYVTTMTSKIISGLMARAHKVGLTPMAKFQPTMWFLHGKLDADSEEGQGRYCFTMRTGLGVLGADLAEYARKMGGVTVRSFGQHGSDQFGSVYVTFDVLA